MEWLGNQAWEEFDSYIGLREGYSLSPPLFAILIHNILRKLDWHNHSLSSDAKEAGISITFCRYLVTGTLISIDLQRTMNFVQECWKDWNLKINIEKTKVAVFKMGGRLNKNEKWRWGREEIEVSNRIKCLGIIMGSRRKWGMEGKLAINSIIIFFHKRAYYR
jgi:hypothetical protein